MDPENLYNEMLVFLGSLGLEVPADADDMLANACRLIAEDN